VHSAAHREGVRRQALRIELDDMARAAPREALLAQELVQPELALGCDDDDCRIKVSI